MEYFFTWKSLKGAIQLELKPNTSEVGECVILYTLAAKLEQSPSRIK